MQEQDSATSGIKQAAREYFQAFRDKTTWHEEDTVLTKIGKVLLHITGIFVLIALSPVLLFSLIVAFVIAL